MTICICICTLIYIDTGVLCPPKRPSLVADSGLQPCLLKTSSMGIDCPDRAGVRFRVCVGDSGTCDGNECDVLAGLVVWFGYSVTEAEAFCIAPMCCIAGALLSWPTIVHGLSGRGGRNHILGFTRTRNHILGFTRTTGHKTWF